MTKSEKKSKQGAEKSVRKDPYEVLGLPQSSIDQEIKSSYRKLALKYHPDKNANVPEIANMFTEITFSYDILSDPDKRRLFDTDGFETVFCSTGCSIRLPRSRAKSIKSGNC